jgi:hypothetical protein
MKVSIGALIAALLIAPVAPAAHADPAPPTPTPVVTDPGNAGAMTPAIVPDNPPGDTYTEVGPDGTKYTVSLAPDAPTTQEDVDDDVLILIDG